MAGSRVGHRARNYVDRYHGTGIGGRDPGGLDGHRWPNSVGAGIGVPAGMGQALGPGKIAIPEMPADGGGGPLPPFESGPPDPARGTAMRDGLLRWGIFR